MKNPFRALGIVLLVLMGFIGVLWFQSSLVAAHAAAAGNKKSFKEVPVRGMVTMIDLGAIACIPCKMMAPIMEKMEKKYEGKAAIIFIDVWKDPAPGKKFGIRVIPTQIFFDKEGKEVYRHEGFLSEEAIVTQLKGMGVPDA